MPNAIDVQIKERLQAFVNELDLLVRKSTLDSLRGVLEGGAAPARRGRPPGSGRGPGRPAATGSTDDLPAKITAHVRSSPGQTVGEIVSAVGGKSAAVKKTIKAMLDAGDLRKAGQKRGTRYFPPGPGRLPGATTKGAKRGKKKATRSKARKAKRRASLKKKATKPKRNPAATRSPKKALVIPMRRRPAPAPKAVMADTDVPQALAVG